MDDEMKTLWDSSEERFSDYYSLIGGSDRVRLLTQMGVLHLLRVSRVGDESLGKLELFPDVPATEREAWSHPALVGNRIHVRNLLGIYCFLLE